MQVIRNRIISMILVISMSLSFGTTVQAATDSKKSVKYPNCSTIVDPSEDSSGKVNAGSFMKGRTRGGTDIWVLKEFEDDIGSGPIAEAIDRARKYGVAEGFEDGTFKRWDNSEIKFTEAFIARFFHETGVKEKITVGGIKLGTIETNRSFSTSTASLSRKEAILRAGKECSEASSGVKMDDFSTTLGKWAVPRATPDGKSSDDIYPHALYDDTTTLTSTCKELGYFTDSDVSGFKGEYAQAANILMFAGVLQGFDDGSGLQPTTIINRGQMVKILITLADAIDHGATNKNVPDEVKLSARLEMSSSDTEINYKDWDDGDNPVVEVTFDGSGSSGDKFTIEGKSEQLGDEIGKHGLIGHSTKEELDLEYPQKDMVFFNDDHPGTTAKDHVGQSIRDYVYGTMTAEGGGEEEDYDAQTQHDIEITNHPPTASMTVTSQMPGQEFPDSFFYVEQPIYVSDSSSDYEAELEEVKYVIVKDDQNVAIITNYTEVDNPNDDWLTINTSGKNFTFSTTKPGNYTIRVIVRDECGVSDSDYQRIYIAKAPEPPTAIIGGTDGYAFLNLPTPVKDASTDPNNDIVDWKWDGLQKQKTNADGTTSWEAANNVSKSGLQNYHGSKKDASVDGSFTFTEKGVYQVGLTVTDATSLSDHTTKELKVIESIPVPDFNVGPNDPNADTDNPTIDPDNPPQYPYWDGDTLVVKQNRKFTIDLSDSLDPPDSPIVWDQTEWSKASLDGYNMNRVKEHTTSKKHHEYVAKDVGSFTITVTLHNSYSDNKYKENPGYEDLKARTKTVTVKVVPDQPPVTAITVDGAQPNFHDNPTSVDVRVVSNASSPDDDIIQYYDWSLYRDSNNDGNYSEREKISNTGKTTESEYKLNVPFQSGNTSLFMAKVKVTEEFGQPTIDSDVSPSDRLTAEDQTEFEVNWRPCITYTWREWAYTDDVILVSTAIKDENIETCTTQWTLYKQNGDNWDVVDTNSLEQWNMGLHGGQMKFNPEDNGWYRLKVTITDAEGHSEDYWSDHDLRIYHLPIARISENTVYDWNRKNWNYKESRRFDINGNASSYDNAPGPVDHPIDHAKDYWKIIPLDGQKVSNIYMMNDSRTGRMTSRDNKVFYVGNNALDEQISILDTGRYKIQYQVTNSYNKKSPMVEQEFTVEADEVPTITGITQPKVYRGGLNDDANVPLTITDLTFESLDSDEIANYSVRLAYDSDNDGTFADEQWEDVTVAYGGLTVTNDSRGKKQVNVSVYKSEVGKYRYQVYTKEEFGQPSLSIVPDSARKTSSKYFDLEIDNNAPIGKFTTTTESKGDVVFANGDSLVSKDLENASRSFKNRFGTEDKMDVQVKAIDVASTVIDSSSLDFDTIVNSWTKMGADCWAAKDGDLICALPGGNWDGLQHPGQESSSDSVFKKELPNMNETAIFDPNSYDTSDFTAELSVDLGIGMMEGFAWHVTHNEDTDTYNGYFLNFDSDKGGGSQYNIALTKMENVYFDEWFFEGGPIGSLHCYGFFSNENVNNSIVPGSIKQVPLWGKRAHKGYGKITVLDGFHTRLSGNLEISMNGNDIVVKQNGSIVLSATDDTYKTGTFGFWGNNCQGSDSMKIHDIKITAKSTNLKYLSNELTNVSWRSGAERFVVYTADDTSGFGGTIDISSLDANMRQILNTWIQFPRSQKTWAYNTEKETLTETWDSTIETGFLMPDKFDATDVELGTEVFADGQQDQPLGLLFKVHPSEVPNCGTGRYDMYMWWVSGPYAILWKITGFNPNQPNTSATPLCSYEPQAGTAISVPSIGWHDWDGLNGDGVSTNTGLFGQSYITDLTVGKKIQNKNDRYLTAEVLSFVHLSSTVDLGARAPGFNPTGPKYPNTIYSYGWHDMRVSMHGNKIVCKFDEDTVTYTDPDPFEKGTMGFFALSNVNPNFRNFSISTQPNVFDSDEYARLQALLLKENIHLIVLGTKINENISKTMLGALEAQGMFTLNQPVDTALTSAETFIKEILRNSRRTSNWILLNEFLEYNKEYSDANGDPQWLWSSVNFTEQDWIKQYWLYKQSDGSKAAFDYTITIPSSIPAEYQSDFEAFKKKMETFWKDPSILAQKFKYYHDENFFDNSLGAANFRSIDGGKENWMNTEVTTFDKVGRYRIDYRIKDNPVPNKRNNTQSNPFDEYRKWSNFYANDMVQSDGNIANPWAILYVHRKPVADFSFTTNRVNDVVHSITITDKAYDLDHNITRADKGLRAFEWKWRFSAEKEWKTATFSTAAEGVRWINSQLVDLHTKDMSNILIQYRVQDIDGEDGIGVWSDTNAILVSNNPQKPIASFVTDSTIYDLGQKIQITDESYSPNGDGIKSWKFTVERQGEGNETVTMEKEYTNSNSDSVSKKFSDDLFAWIDNQQLSKEEKSNQYKITLVVTDTKSIPLESDPFSWTITISPTNHVPNIDIPDRDNPDNPGGNDGGGKSLWGKNNPTIYEYDDYDASLNNPYYTYGGQAQKRGTEYLDWTLTLTDPDNSDKYGPANDTTNYLVQFKTDRSNVSSRKNFGNVSEAKTYPEKNVTADQAKVNTNLAPFTNGKDGGLKWGAYQITTNVTDIPLNGAEGKTTTMVTSGTEKPLHLYVIPKLDLDGLEFIYDNIVNNPEKISPGEDILVNATTNVQSTGARLIYKDGTGAVHTQEMTCMSENANGTYSWSTTLTLPEDLEEDDLGPDDTYVFTVQTYTNYGTMNGEETRQKEGTITVHILPLKLYDFQITGINDPSVRHASYPVYVKDLAFDKNNNIDPVTGSGSLTKLGYAFNFTMYSKGLKNDDDTIRIRPSFYGFNNATGRYDVPLDMYYKNDDGLYVLATTDPNGSIASGDNYKIYLKGNSGTLLGSLRQIDLPTSVRTIDGTTQKWSARYGIPGSAVFVPKGKVLTDDNLISDENHGILILFDLEAMKGGISKYNYVGKGQWSIERRNEATGTLENPSKSIYEDGSVIVLDPTRNSLDNYESRPVWTK